MYRAENENCLIAIRKLPDLDGRLGNFRFEEILFITYIPVRYEQRSFKLWFLVFAQGVFVASRYLRVLSFGCGHDDNPVNCR